MQVRVRSISAQCTACGGEEFEAADGKRFELASQTTLRCVQCGARSTYVELIIQIAQKTVVKSSQTLAEVRRRRGRPRDPD